MERRVQLIIFLLLGIFPLYLLAAAPPVTDWQRCLGGSGQDMPVRMIRSTDSYIYVLGSSGSVNGDVSNNHGSNDFWLTKLDTSGNLIWQKNFGGTNMDIGTSLVQMSNGDLVLAGYTASSNGDVTVAYGNFDVWVLRINPGGNIIWQRSFGGSQVDLCYAMIKSSDGGLLLGGGSYSNDGDVNGNHGDQDFWLLKLDANGNKQWQRSLGGSGLDVCYNLIENNSGEYIACGSSNSNNGDVSGNHGRFDFWVVKLNASGSLIWQKSLGGSDNESAFSLAITNSNQYLIAGYSKSSDGQLSLNYGFTDYWLTLLDNQGDLVLQKSFGGSGADVAYDVINTVDGGYLLTGGSTSNDGDTRNNQGLEDVWLVKIDASLNLEWSRSYGGSGNERPSQAIQTSDGGFIVTAYTFSNDLDVSGNHGSSDFWILKLACKNPVASFSTSSLHYCSSDSIQFINSSANASEYSWNLNGSLFSTKRIPSMVISQSGNYTIQLQAHTCYASSQSAAPVEIHQVPVVNIGADTTLCQNQTIQLSGPAGSFSYTWQDGSMAQNLLVAQAGTYSVLVSNGFCQASDTININYTICNLPVANFSTTVQEICKAGEIQFQDISQNAITWTWYFPGGNPSTSTQQNPLVKYDQAGNYSVMLTVSDGNTSHSIMRVNYVTVNPDPAKPLIQISGNQLTSSFADKYQWIFNNQDIPGSINQIHYALNSGYYQVEISDINSCKAKSDSVLFLTTGLTESKNELNKITIWPNPTSGLLNIKENNSATTKSSIRIYNIQGRLIDIEATSFENDIRSIDLSGEAPGIYLLEISNDSKKELIKINKQ